MEIISGEDINLGELCFISESDGKLYRYNSGDSEAIVMTSRIHAENKHAIVLTDMEAQVARMFCEEKSDKEVAAELNVSVGRVAQIRGALVRKLYRFYIGKTT